MPEYLCDPSVSTYSLPRQGVTHTVLPVAPIPVYFIHSFEQPFCTDTTCQCHRQQQEVVELFVKIIEGRFELEQAAVLLAENRKERRA